MALSTDQNPAALQEGEIQRVGSSRTIRVNGGGGDQQALEEMVREKTFREDLYYRSMWGIQFAAARADGGCTTAGGYVLSVCATARRTPNRYRRGISGAGALPARNVRELENGLPRR